MKKIIAIFLVCCLCIGLYGCSSAEEIATTAEQIVEIELNANNFRQYFDVSVEYYNYHEEYTKPSTILGVNLPGVYTASVTQKIKITPKSHVLSCKSVSIDHYANISVKWTYDEKNHGDTEENREKNDWLITLASDGTFEGSKTMYYFDISDAPTCPAAASSLNVSFVDGISGTVTIKK